MRQREATLTASDGKIDFDPLLYESLNSDSQVFDFVV